MSEAEIQSFLDAQIGTCLNTLCLNVLRMNTSNDAASYTSAGTLVCSAYTGAANERASTIIFKVQQACSISAKVILVTLQKEQSLVTRTSPSLGILERAMGYGCPDTTGGTCAAEYYGFFNQVLNAAWQLKRYGAAPIWGTYKTGWNTIQWNPNAACGSTQVFVHNRATAALYNYTPYQPNAAALANLRGTGDGCSAYGNRNFWVYYNDWFGSTNVPAGTPEGAVTVTPATGGIQLDGWAVDPDSVLTTVAVSIQVDSSWHALYASTPGADRSGSYPGAGNRHDFRGLIPAAPGPHTMCIYLVNAGGVGSTGTLGCRQVVVPSAPAPVGAITSAVASGRTVTFSGWAVQPENPTNPVPIALNYGSQWSALVANQPNTAAPAAVTGAGPNQGYSGTFQAEPGVRTFCIWAARQSGPAEQIGCRTLLVPDIKQSLSAIESITGTSSGVNVAGWAVWPGSPATSVPVAVNVGSSWYALSADKPSTAAAAAAPGSGPNHGFTGSIPLAAGNHSVCIWVAQPTTAAELIGCRTVTVSTAPTTATRAEIQSIVADSSGVTVSGWAVWPGSVAASVPVAVNIGASWYALSANQPNPAAETALPGSGPNHGFLGTIPVGVGTHNVCIWTSNAAGGATQVGCQTVTRVADAGAVGELNTLVGAVGGLHYEGWAVQPTSPSAPVSIAANIGNQWIPLVTDEPNAIAPTKFSGAGPNQGYSGLIPAPVGTHSVCMWAASPAGPVNLGCKSATVSAAPAVAGQLTAVSATPGTVTMAGWAVWPTALTTPVAVAINVGSAWYAVPTGVASTVTADYVAGAGPNQGFSGSMASASGSQQVCAWAATPNAPATMIGCKTVVVP